MDLMFVDFLNSEWYDGHGRLDDRLVKPQWFNAFRRRWGFAGRRTSSARERMDPHPYFSPQSGPLEARPVPARSRALPSPILQELLELRIFLRRLTEKIAADQDISSQDIKQLNGFLEHADVRHSVHKTSDGLRLDRIPLEEDEESLVGMIALSAAEFLADGDRLRLKTCRNPGCRWVFYDETKNRGRMWCDTDLCGNLFRVRRYRGRRK